MRISAILCVLLLPFVPASLVGQDAPPADTDAAGPLRIFLDCQGVPCDFDFFREQIPYVRYVRDRRDADVHILITAQPTGGGGREHTVTFIGQGAFADLEDVQRYVSPRDATQDEIRRGLVHTVRLGLVRYLARTSAGERIRVTMEEIPAAAASPSPEDDPWNLWTFRVGMNGFFNGEASYAASNVSGSLNANRTTEAWKLNLTLNSRYSESQFEISDELTIVNIQRNHGLSGLLVRSMGRHWSAGARGSLGHSTFLNQDLSARISPAVEYNFFPYAESTRRQFTAQYGLGVSHFDYMEETIFERDHETLLDHTLLLTLDLRQPWGSVSTSLEGAQYLTDPSKQRVVLFSNLDLRLVRGLSFRTFGSVSMLRDQIYLPARGASPEEILLRQRQLATSFRYFASLGLSYSFGSRFHGVVNPRFRGASGGMVIID